MYAIIEVGGKQYKVTKGDVVDLERQGKKEGQSLTFKRVLLVAENDNVHIGQPHVKNAKVTAVVVRNFKARKVVSYKYRRRKSSHSKRGHRQLLTKVRIEEIMI